eukprot:788578-Amphidinium_carterae.2
MQASSLLQEETERQAKRRQTGAGVWSTQHTVESGAMVDEIENPVATRPLATTQMEDEDMQETPVLDSTQGLGTGPRL